MPEPLLEIPLVLVIAAYVHLETVILLARIIGNGRELGIFREAPPVQDRHVGTQPFMGIKLGGQMHLAERSGPVTVPLHNFRRRSLRRRKNPHSPNPNGRRISAGQKKFWPYVNGLYAGYDEYNVGRMQEQAVKLGMDPAAFAQAYSAPATRQALIAAKQEGIRNKVKATPTFFINGRKYVYEMDLETLTDVIEEELLRK